MTNSIQEQREELQQIIWDVAKDATGCRPRWIDFENSTIEELERTLELYSNMAAEVADQEAAMEAEAIAEYEALVQSNIDMGAGDRETAVRWIVQSETAERYVQDVDCILYHWNMPFFEPKLPAHIKPELRAALRQVPQAFDEEF